MTPFTAMQHAVDIVSTSEHNKNKIASCLFTTNNNIARVNHRPDILKSKFTPDLRVGKASQFIHSETACLFDANFPTEGASICITDPMCPNCAKAICESGITHVYIDHKGLDKDFAQRRGNDFQSLSLLMMEKAGIIVSILNRKVETLETLIEPPVITRKGAPQGIEFFDWDNDLTLKDYLQKFRNRQAHSAWAIAQIEENGHKLGIIVFEELTRGLTPQVYAENRRISEKYRLPVDPLNRLLFFTKRKGFTLQNKELAVNLAPSSRALVNATGYGISTVYVGEDKPDHDDLSHIAIELLQENGVLTINHL